MFGSGARAEVLRVLLASREPIGGAEFADAIGFSKQVISEIVTDLHRSGIAEEHRIKNQLKYRLRDAHGWTALLGPLPVVWPKWSHIFPLLIVVMESIERSRGLPTRVAEVEIDKLQRSLLDSLFKSQLRLPTLDTDPRLDRLEVLNAWAVQIVTQLARADVSAFYR